MFGPQSLNSFWFLQHVGRSVRADRHLAPKILRHRTYRLPYRGHAQDRIGQGCGDDVCQLTDVKTQPKDRGVITCYLTKP